LNVSIIIATYNSGKYLGRAIRSCLDQSMDKKLYEVIVVDDGSTDYTDHVLHSFGDLIRVIKLEKNMGLPYACNVGIKNTISQFFIRVDADDYIHHDLLKVENLYLAMNNDIDAVSCDYLLVDDQENIIKRVSGEEEPIACGIMFRKDRVVEIGLYDENFLLSEDEDLRIRYMKKFNIFNVPLPLYRYRIHANNLTKNFEKVVFYKKMLKGKHNLDN
jgi:glycosyltransferase involved in cell wall biosynthesis